MALCDDDPLFSDVTETVLSRMGHEVVGVAPSPLDAVALIERAHPDLVVIDPAMGFGSDFDVVETALGLGADTVVFSQGVDDTVLAHYDPRPEVVRKPDFDQLQVSINRMIAAHRGEHDPSDRRTRPQRAAQGPDPKGLEDAQAFYEALNNVLEGDVLFELEQPPPATHEQARAIAEHLAPLIRDTDRLLATSSGVRVLLVGGGIEGRYALLSRLAADPPPEGTRVTSVVVAGGECGYDAFSRLRRTGTVHD